jgi:hypothetical protein
VIDRCRNLLREQLQRRAACFRVCAQSSLGAAHCRPFDPVGHSRHAKLAAALKYDRLQHRRCGSRLVILLSLLPDQPRARRSGALSINSNTTGFP